MTLDELHHRPSYNFCIGFMYGSIIWIGLAVLFIQRSI